jgi:hypothetical protein
LQEMLPERRQVLPPLHEVHAHLQGGLPQLRVVQRVLSQRREVLSQLRVVQQVLPQRREVLSQLQVVQQVLPQRREVLSLLWQVLALLQ